MIDALSRDKALKPMHVIVKVVAENFPEYARYATTGQHTAVSTNRVFSKQSRLVREFLVNNGYVAE